MRIITSTLFALLLILHLAGSPIACADGLHIAAESEKRQPMMRKALLGSAFLLGSLATMLEIESDREYSHYLQTAHPGDMHSHYDRAERYRNLSTAALLVAEVCAVGFVVISLRERPTEESKPDTVRITFHIGASRAGLSLTW